MNAFQTYPHFLIVGAAKCGTTSVYNYLRQHPDIFMPEWKEPAYFSPAAAGGIQDLAAYSALFKQARPNQIRGEASVSYLAAAESAQRICEELGKDTKIIIFLRHPVDMAYSLWGHQVREGFETLDFKSALAAEAERLQKNEDQRLGYSWVYDYAYKYRADYMPQIARYDERFGKDKVKIFIFEEFFKDDLPLFDELCAFLGVKTGFRPLATRHNVAGTVHSRKLRTLLVEPSVLKNFLKLITPNSFRQRLRQKLENINRKDAPLPPIDPTIRYNLYQKFKPGITALESRLNRPPGSLWPLPTADKD